MKVELKENLLNADNERIKYSTSHSVKEQAGTAKVMGGYSLDISGTVTDNAAYGMGELKSSDELMQDAGQVDVALQRKYMAVMSNSMSAEDYAKLSEDGQIKYDISIEEQVTSLDKIKATLAENGVVIEGYNDDLSSEEIEKIAGNISTAAMITEALVENNLPVNESNVSQMKDVLDAAALVSNVTDDMKKYMLSNNMRPTIDNLYRAQYSAGEDIRNSSRGFYRDDRYYVKRPENLDFDSIKKQAEKIIENAGLNVNDETLGEAKWIVERSIPYTETTAQLLNEINSIEFPIDNEALTKKIAAAIADGKTAGNTNLADSKSVNEEAKEILNKVNGISEDAVEGVTRKGLKLTINNLYKEDKELEADKELEYHLDYNKEQNEDASLLSARRFLEETRLTMTLEANRSLIRQGIRIDTVPLSELVEKLKEAEKNYYSPLLTDRNAQSLEEKDLLDKIDLFKNTRNIFESLRSVPSEVLAKIDKKSEQFTAGGLAAAGEELRKNYEAAGKSYEALMTAPRKDMGDSIQKAFRNVDEILKDNNFALTEDNRKAVRILGYAGMEINKDSIERVRDAEKTVQRVIEKMTPSKTLELIREGENPLDENLYELEKKLSERSEEESTDSYARFLVKLENKKEINETEKEAYIGIFRMFRQLEKSDGKLIGNVLNTGAELNFRNIISSMRSNKAVNMDARIDDSFGMLESYLTNKSSISDQIDRAFNTGEGGEENKNYYSNLVKDVLDKISPQALSESNVYSDTTIEEFVENISSYKEDAKDLYKEDVSNMKQAQEVSDRVIEELLNSNQEVTVNNLLAMDRLINDRGSYAKSLMSKLTKEDNKQKIKASMEAVTQNCNDKDSIKASIDELKDECSRIIEEEAFGSSLIDVREMCMINKQLSVIAANAVNENYEVPVEIDGEWTSVNVKIIHDSQNSGSVSLVMETESFGKMAAQFFVSQKEVKGYVTGDKKEGIDALIKRDQELRESLSGKDRTVTELDYLDAKTLSLDDFARKSSTEKDAATKDLYEVAKALIVTVSRINK